MKKVLSLVTENQEGLVRRVLQSARARGHSKSLELGETWLPFLSGMSDQLLLALEPDLESPSWEQEADVFQDPLTRFGMQEARKLKPSGVSLKTFLELLEFSRQSFVDLVREAGLDPDGHEYSRHLINHCFDRTKIGFSLEWLGKIPVSKVRPPAAQDSAKLYRLLAENVRDVIWTMDLQFHLTYVSPSIRQLTGFDPEEYLLLTPSQILAPASLKLARDRLAQEMPLASATAAPTPSNNIIELELIRKDGSTVWAEVRTSFLRDPQGAPVSILGVSRDLTQRRQAEQRIRESEDRYRELFNNMPSGVAVYEVTGEGRNLVFKDFNRAAEQIEQVQREDVLGRNLLEVFPGTEDCGLLGIMRQVWQTGQAQYACVPYCQDRSISGWRENYIYKLPSGELVAVYEDITLRKQAEENLRTVNATLRALVAASPEAIYTLDLQGKITSWNPAAEKIYGWSATEAQGQICPIVPPDKHEEFRGLLGLVLGGDQFTARELCRQRRDGSLIHVAISAAPIRDGAGKVSGVIAMSSDITERKIQQEQLRESEARYRAIFERGAIGISITDAQGHLVETNPAMQHLLGYSKEELSTMTFAQVTHPDHTARDWAAFQQMMAGERDNYETEKRYIRKDGQEIWAQLVVSLLRDAQGNPWFTLGITKNISARKRAEIKVARQSALMHGINRIFKEALSCETVENLGQTCLAVAEELTGSPISFIKEQDSNGRLQNIALSKGALAACAIPAGEQSELLGDIQPNGWAARVIQTNQPFIINAAGSVSTLSLLPGHPRITSFLGVPLPRRGDFVGLIGLANKEPGYDSADRETVESLGSAIIEALLRKRAELQLQDGLSRLRKNLGEIVQAMALTVEIKDPYTSGHQRRVTQLALTIAAELGLSKKQCDGLWVAGILHDLGKIYIPEGILSRPGPLTNIEMNLIRTHPQVGYDILKTINFPWPVAKIVLQHHERLDGSGYPLGLTADDILLEAKILAVADVVEAMASHRPYRPSLGLDAALAEITKNQGSLYDPEIVKICVKLFLEKNFSFSSENVPMLLSDYNSDNNKKVI
jgi:PAS domain S-box-containing protein/putative nucleotidyltransferase with HDIG domain